MNFSTMFNELHQKYPVRHPGSVELAAVMKQIRETAASNAITTELNPISVYSARTAFLSYLLLSCAVLLLSLVIPWAGLLGQLILSIILLREFVSPALSRIKPGNSDDFIIKIPARSKESQQIYLTAALSTDRFCDLGAASSGPWLIGGGAVLPLLFQAGNFLLGSQAGGQIALILEAVVLVIGLLVSLRKEARPDAKDFPNDSLANSAVLLELAALLVKSRASITSVTIILTGASSLNSGILKTYPELKQKELAYWLHLTDQPGKQIQVAASEGPVIPSRSDPVLLELLTETARQKNIAVAAKPLPEIQETYPLKLMGRKAVTLGNPLAGTANRDLRELLIGLIRTVDHPQE